MLDSYLATRHLPRNVTPGQSRRGCALCLNAATLAGAVGPAFAEASPPAAPAEIQAPKSSLWVPVIAADEIIGRLLHDPRGHDAGRIENIVVDLVDGRAVYAVVGSGGELNLHGQEVVLPFGAVRLRDAAVTNEAMRARVSVSADAIANAPRVDRDHIENLGPAEGIAEIARHYGIPGPQDDAASAAHPGRLALVESASLGGLLSDGGSAVVIHDTAVRQSPKGAIGDIERVMIDPDSHHVAYVLVFQSGFLGLSGTWIPLPMQALEWSDQQQAFVLRSNTPVEGMAVLQKSKLPERVHRDEIQLLYERYGVMPYWRPI
jgi:sporulation protein YlmC with PRC-barrel domain